jgi:hypothetical protein
MGVTDVYASWNGATGVAAWQLLAGASSSSLAAIESPVARQGFETRLATTNAGPYYAVQPLDAAGNVLGTSRATRVPPPRKPAPRR